jgi:hypothetical protein
MLALADYTNDKTWWAWPSVEALAEKARLSIRQTIRVLSKLEDELGEIQIDQNGGPNGVNRYQLLLGTKGKLTEPPESSRKGRGDILSGVTFCQDGIHEKSKSHSISTACDDSDVGVGGDILSGVTFCQGDISGPQMSPGTVRNQDTHTQGPGGPVEWPSEEEVLRVAREYPGNLGLGIPAKIPEVWAAKWWGWRTFEVKRWPADWKRGLVWRFERDWQDGVPAARGEQFFSKVGGGGGRKNSGAGEGVWSMRQRLEELKKMVASHPANEQSSAYCGEPTSAQTEEYGMLLKQQREIEGKIAGVTA